MASPTQAGAFAFRADSASPSSTRFVACLVLAGLINASIAAFLLCRLPSSHLPSLTQLVVRAALYVSLSVLAGLVGSRFYWSRASTAFASGPPLSFNVFASINAHGWVWVPAVVLLSAQDSPAAPMFAAIGAALIATGLRKSIAADAIPRQLHSCATPWEERELFAETLRTQPREAHPYLIAICLYAGVFALNETETQEASALFALCAFLMAWKLTLAPAGTPPPRKRKAGMRLASVALAAILVTLFALLYGVDSRNRAEAAVAAQSAAAAKQAQQKPAQPAEFVPGFGGYESIILWPVPEKKPILAPIPIRPDLDAARNKKPQVIHFDGAYWYFQPPGTRPSPQAHQAHGSPIDANIRSTNYLPLTMEAHQNLGAPIRLNCCRAIQVTIENHEGTWSPIALGVLLTDSAAPGKPDLFLGQQPILSTQPGHAGGSSGATTETLTFSIPARARIRKFDAITIVFAPSDQRVVIGPKIAIQRFELIPR
jgi:hypothetical protein